MKRLLGIALAMLVLATGCTPDEDVPSPPPSPGAVTTTPDPDQRWQPRVGASFFVQYTGKVDFDRPVEVYNLDGERTTTEDVQRLAARGVAAICYFNAGAFEDFRSDKDRFPKAVIGEPLDGWPGEHWLDIRQVDTLLPIMAARMDACRAKGFVAVDPDNTDGWTQETGFPLSPEDQIAYQRALAREAHARGLAIGLKNDPDQIDQMAGIVDFAVNEECVAYKECDKYAAFLAGGKAVFNIEYAGNRDKVCAERPAGMSTVIANRGLSGRITGCP